MLALPSTLPFLLFLSSLAAAAPVPLKRANLISEQAYADFQISGGQAGNALAEAKAIFVDPFNGVDLKSVTQADINALSNMRVAAESAETEFNNAISAAGGTTSASGIKLQNGKIKNKVLKLQGLAQINTIKLAQKPGDSSIQAALDDDNTKLNANVKQDVAHKGQESTPIAGSSNNAAVKQTTSTSTAAASGNLISEKAYADFQISGTNAGNALAEAKAIFVDPFNGVDLKTVSQADINALSNMRVAAESAETDFNNAISAAGGTSTAAGIKLQNGKIKNKVLKLQGLAQINTIKLAQKPGDATIQAALDDDITKLNANVKQDVAHNGQGSTAIAGSTNSAAVVVKTNTAAVSGSGSSCFLVGSVALPAEVTDGLSALSGVTCSSPNTLLSIPDLTSGSTSFSAISFQNSGKSALGFALEKFPVDPSTAQVSDIQDALNVYLAAEAGVRSIGGNSRVLADTKDVKFFLQFQVARINAAQGVKVGAAGTVEHQLGKVQKNAIGATAAEKAALLALSQ